MKRSALFLTALVLMNLAPFSSPRSAGAAEVTLYELTENMQWLLRPHGTTYRVATSALTGWATLGSPLCPATLVATYNPGASACAVNATGSDRIDVRTGQGDFSGTLDVVVQGDNPVDGPELVVMTGSFQGQMDFSPALVQGVPYGTVVGTMNLSKANRSIPFTGVFRLPFAGNYAGPETGGATLRQVFCPGTPNANPYAAFYDGWDFAYLSTSSGAPDGRCLDIGVKEISLGAPLVRFEVSFGSLASP